MKINTGNVNSSEEKEGEGDGKETGTAEKTSEIEERVSEDEMETVETASVFHQFHDCFIFLEGRQKRED